MSRAHRTRSTASTLPKLRVGISSCLLGERVRYDGGHKRDKGILSDLGGYFEWVSVCPEVEIGLGVPRDPLHLEGPLRAPRLVVTDSGEDLSERMRRFARRRVEALLALPIHGYVLKSKSPSCGLGSVEISRSDGRAEPARRGDGLFAAVLRARAPRLPVVEETDLATPAARERFVEQVRAYAAGLVTSRRSW